MNLMGWIKISHIIVFGVLVFAFTQPVRAGEKIDYKHKTTIDGIEYSTHTLIWDFTNVAISRHLWLDDSDEPIDNVLRFSESTIFNQERNNYEDRKKLFPQFARYMFRPDGMPNAFSINKWKNKITIGLGWQKKVYGTGEKQQTRREIGFNPWGGAYENSFPVFQKHIEDLIPEIEKLTGLPVVLYDPEDPREKTLEHAKIRIVPQKLIGGRIAGVPYAHDELGRHPTQTIESYFGTGVPFTAFRKEQVDGYIIPESDNTLDYAACKIRPDLTEELTKALITECLARVLGLPELSKISTDSVLGHINEPEKEKGLLDSLFSNDEDKNKPEDSFTDYDRFMIALLYCPDIKPGMDIYEVIQTLKFDSKCVDSAVRKLE